MDTDILLWTIISVVVIAALLVPVVVIFRRMRSAGDIEENTRHTEELRTQALEGHPTAAEQAGIEAERHRNDGQQRGADVEGRRRESEENVGRDETDR